MTKMPLLCNAEASATPRGRFLTVIALGLMLGGCVTDQERESMSATPAQAKLVSGVRASEHRGSDDLLTAGLGRDGLRAMAAPAFADPAHPTPMELRRRAIWSNWRGIADL